MIATLKAWLGSAGSLLDDTAGLVGARLYDILQALAEGSSDTLTGFLATPAVAVMNSIVVDKPTKLRNLRMHVGTTGTADSTTCRVLVNGSAVSGATLTIANTEADGSSDTVDLNTALAAGDLVQIDLSAIPTGGADATVSCRMNPVTVE